MRLVVLSDHPGDMLAEARQRRESADRQAAGRHQRELAGHRNWIAEAREQRDLARARRRPLAWLRWGLAARRRQRAWPPQPPQSLPVPAEEKEREAGVEGEGQAASVLDGALDNAWIAVKGYRNMRGEIDYLILGPAGLFAVEVKYVNGTFRITQGKWRYVKHDKYGIQHPGGDLQDDHGRPPDVQLREPAEQLERFLASRGQPVRLQPVVLLSHPRARIGHIDGDLGVQVLASAQQLARLALGAGGNFGEGQLARIAGLVERDHRFCEQRRRG